MARTVTCFAALAWLALIGASVGVQASLHAERISKDPVKHFGSYIVTCTDSAVTFLNFPNSDMCEGTFTSYSGSLNQCGLEYISPVGRNFSWNALCDGVHMVYNNFADDSCATPAMLSRTYNVGACYACPNEICKDGINAPPNIFGPLAVNTPWMENQWHSEPGVAFITSMNAGMVFRGKYNASGDCVSMNACNVTHEPWIWGFKSISGITYDAKIKRFWALAVAQAVPETNMLISFAADGSANHSTNNYTVHIQLPAELNLFGNLTLNGLAQHDGGKPVFYGTSLGNFSAGLGQIYAIDVEKKQVALVAGNLTGADGAFVWRGRLYVSEVFSATVHVFDISKGDPFSPTQIITYVPEGVTSLDDFFVFDWAGEARIFGADWNAGRIASWSANGTANTTQIHAAGLTHPTSVRPEVEADGQWKSDYVTVTQGGAFPVKTTGANGGGVYRLRLKHLPPRIKSAGALIDLEFNDATCNSTNVVGTSTLIEECIIDKQTNTSFTLECSELDIHKRVWNNTECKGDKPDHTTMKQLTCYKSGTTSHLYMCAKLTE